MFGLGLLKGLGVTMRHFIESYVYDRKPWEKRYDAEWLKKHQDIDGKGIFTVQYPEQKRQIPENFRFFPMLVYDKTPDEPRCTACGICARVCPPQCIWIFRSNDPNTGRPIPSPAQFYIDTDICMNCGMCAEYCPFDAIKMDHDFEIASYDRLTHNIYDIEKLSKPVSYYAQIRPVNFKREETARAEKEAAKAAGKRAGSEKTA